MILLSFISEDNVLSDEIKNAIFLNIKVMKIEHSAFFGTPGIEIMPIWLQLTIVGFTRIAVNFQFHSWFANFKLTSSLGCVWMTHGF